MQMLIYHSVVYSNDTPLDYQIAAAEMVAGSSWHWAAWSDVRTPLHAASMEISELHTPFGSGPHS